MPRAWGRRHSIFEKVSLFCLHAYKKDRMPKKAAFGLYMRRKISVLAGFCPRAKNARCKGLACRGGLEKAAERRPTGPFRGKRWKKHRRAVRCADSGGAFGSWTVGNAAAGRQMPRPPLRPGARRYYESGVSLRHSRMAASAASTSCRNARAETRSAPCPRMISCSSASLVATRTRQFLPS